MKYILTIIISVTALFICAPQAFSADSISRDDSIRDISDLRVETVADANCGNGTMDQGENCDPNVTDPCLWKCNTLTWPGVGVRICTQNPTQQNEYAPPNLYCSPTCECAKAAPFCGDGTLDPNEQCSYSWNTARSAECVEGVDDASTGCTEKFEGATGWRFINCDPGLSCKNCMCESSFQTFIPLDRFDGLRLPKEEPTCGNFKYISDHMSVAEMCDNIPPVNPLIPLPDPNDEDWRSEAKQCAPYNITPFPGMSEVLCGPPGGGDLPGSEIMGGGLMHVDECKCYGCGDGIVLLSVTYSGHTISIEQCDPASSFDRGGCKPGYECKDCLCEAIKPEPVCGNGIRETGEVCDDPQMGKCTQKYIFNGCFPAGDPKECTCQYCGDGVKNGSEQCDFATIPVEDIALKQCQQPGTTCTSDCKCVKSYCGDNIWDPNTEKCDGDKPGNCEAATPLGQVYAGCSNKCECIFREKKPNEYCGDAIKNGVEECDYMKANALDDCTSPPQTDWIANSCTTEGATAAGCKCMYGPPPKTPPPGCGPDQVPGPPAVDPDEQCDGATQEAANEYCKNTLGGGEGEWICQWNCQCWKYDPTEPEPEPLIPPEKETTVAIKSCSQTISGASTTAAKELYDKLNQRVSEIVGSSISIFGDMAFSTAYTDIMLPGTRSSTAKAQAIKVGDSYEGSRALIEISGAPPYDYSKIGVAGLAPIKQPMVIFPVASDKLPILGATAKGMKAVEMPDLSSVTSIIVSSLPAGATSTLTDVVSVMGVDGVSLEDQTDHSYKLNNAIAWEIIPAVEPVKADAVVPVDALYHKVQTVLAPVTLRFPGAEAIPDYIREKMSPEMQKNIETNLNWDAMMAENVQSDPEKVIAELKTLVDQAKASGQTIDPCEITSNLNFYTKQKFMIVQQKLDEAGGYETESFAQYPVNTESVTAGPSCGRCSFAGDAANVPQLMLLASLMAGSIGGIAAMRRRKK